MKSLHILVPIVLLIASCKGESELGGPPVGGVQPKRSPATAPAPVAAPAESPSEPAPITASAPSTSLGSEGLAAVRIPVDGKYENVSVEGVVVPMINIMNGGEVVLVDTDGKKPRTWEQQYKRKGDLPKGFFDLHKTDVNGNDRFDDDPIDRQGRFRMDEKGNITAG